MNVNRDIVMFSVSIGYLSRTAEKRLKTKKYDFI
jgi:hypothetical protein